MHKYSSQDRSFGVIPYYIENDVIYYLIIQHQAGHRAFPKGHGEGEETSYQSALRELHEETWIRSDQIKILNPNQWLKEFYVFNYKGRKVHKNVRYLLWQCVTKCEIIPQEAELQDCKWATYDEAMQTLTFDAAKELLKEANGLLI